jgi:hypothetical protein
MRERKNSVDQRPKSAAVNKLLGRTKSYGPGKKSLLERTKSTSLLEGANSTGNNTLCRTKSFRSEQSSSSSGKRSNTVERKSSLITDKASSNFHRIKMIIKRDGVYRFRHERTTEPLTIPKPNYQKMFTAKKASPVTKDTLEEIIEYNKKVDWFRRQKPKTIEEYRINWQKAMALTGDFTINEPSAVDQPNDEEMKM